MFNNCTFHLHPTEVLGKTYTRRPHSLSNRGYTPEEALDATASSGGSATPAVTVAQSASQQIAIAHTNQVRLKVIHCYLSSEDSPVVIHGPAGSKTDALRTYCTQQRKTWPKDDWFDATDLLSLQVSYLRYGRKNQLFDNIAHNIQSQLDAVKEHLTNYTGLLIYYRCSEDPEVLNMIPTGQRNTRGIIIAVEKAPTTPQLQSFPTVVFRPYEREDALTYLQQLLPAPANPKDPVKARDDSHEQELQVLYQELGGTPLLLALAAGCIQEPETMAYTQAMPGETEPPNTSKNTQRQAAHSHLSIAQYIGHFQRERKKANNTALAVMTLSLQHLCNYHSGAYHAIGFYCHLPKLSSETLLKRFLFKFFKPPRGSQVNSRDYPESVARQLEIHHILLWSPSGQKVIRPELLDLQQQRLYQKSEFEPYLLGLIRLLCALFIEESQSTHPLSKIEQHAYFFDLHALMESKNKLDWLKSTAPQEYATFFLCFGRLCWFVGQSALSIKHFEQCKDLLNSLETADQARWHNWKAVSQMNLGLFLDNDAIFSKAIDLLNAEEDMDMLLLQAHIYHNRGVNQYYAGNYSDAERWLSEAIKMVINSSLMSNDSLDYANFTQDLALILYLQGKEEEAFIKLESSREMASTHLNTPLLQGSIESISSAHSESNGNDHRNDEVACEVLHRYAALQLQKEPNTAIKVMDDIIKSHTYFPKTLALKGLYLISTADFEGAKECFEKVLEKRAAIPLLMNFQDPFTDWLESPVLQELKGCHLPLIMEPWLLALWKLIEITGNDSEQPDAEKATALSEYALQWIDRYQHLPLGCPMAELCWSLLTLLGDRYHIRLSINLPLDSLETTHQQWHLLKDVSVYWLRGNYSLAALQHGPPRASPDPLRSPGRVRKPRRLPQHPPVLTHTPSTLENSISLSTPEVPEAPTSTPMYHQHSTSDDSRSYASGATPTSSLEHSFRDSPRALHSQDPLDLFLRSHLKSASGVDYFLQIAHLPEDFLQHGGESAVNSQFNDPAFAGLAPALRALSIKLVCQQFKTLSKEDTLRQYGQIRGLIREEVDTLGSLTGSAYKEKLRQQHLTALLAQMPEVPPPDTEDLRVIIEHTYPMFMSLDGVYADIHLEGKVLAKHFGIKLCSTSDVIHPGPTSRTLKLEHNGQSGLAGHWSVFGFTEAGGNCLFNAFAQGLADIYVRDYLKKPQARSQHQKDYVRRMSPTHGDCKIESTPSHC